MRNTGIYRGRSRISRKEIHKGVGVRFADIISIFLNIKLFHFYRIFKNGGGGGGGGAERTRHLYRSIMKCIFQKLRICMFVCLIDLLLYVPVNNLSVTSGRVFLG